MRKYPVKEKRKINHRSLCWPLCQQSTVMLCVRVSVKQTSNTAPLHHPPPLLHLLNYIWKDGDWWRKLRNCLPGLSPSIVSGLSHPPAHNWIKHEVRWIACHSELVQRLMGRARSQRAYHSWKSTWRYLSVWVLSTLIYIFINASSLKLSTGPWYL